MGNDNLMDDMNKVSERINDFLKLDNFDLSIEYLRTIHSFLFDGIYESAARFRNSNVKKREVILNGDSVNYSDCRVMFQDLFKCMISQYNLKYQEMDKESVVKNISLFTAMLWKCHPFDDGNTRTVSVYIQKYLRSLGYNVDNEIFKDNCLYFRNALVKANYSNPEFYIKSDISALEKFFRKVLIDNKIELDINEVYLDDIVKIGRGR